MTIETSSDSGGSTGCRLESDIGILLKRHYGWDSDLILGKES